ncbi:hypothetical protein BGZ76_010061 [Entomortierella beljakovae]|nr:hypothetical protein BGZ76_010061 [Entomortierella beljakovae]
MDLLPTELLLVIAHFIIQDQSSLASCNRLNKRWYQLTRNLLYKEPKLKQQSAFSQFLKTVDTPVMSQYLQTLDRSIISSRNTCRNKETLSSNLPRLHSPISFQSKLYLDSYSFKSTSKGCTEEESRLLLSSSMDHKPIPVPIGGIVEIFNLSMMSHRWKTVDFSLIQSLTLGCPFISTLDLRDCAQLRDNAVQLISEELGPRNLRSLVLSGCIRITDLSILSLCAHAVCIENLELSGCERISDISIMEIGSAVITKAPSIRQNTVDIDGDGNDNDDDNDDDDDNESISTSFIQGISRTIKSLDLSDCTRITDVGIDKLRMGATQLKSLNLEGCYGILIASEVFDETEWEDLHSDDEGDIHSGSNSSIHNIDY